MSEEIGDIGERRDRSDRLLDEFSARLVLANHTHPRNFQNIYSHLQARLFPEGFDWVKLIRPGHVLFRNISLRFGYNSWWRTTSAIYQFADLRYLNISRRGGVWEVITLQLSPSQHSSPDFWTVCTSGLEKWKEISMAVSTGLKKNTFSLSAISHSLVLRDSWEICWWVVPWCVESGPLRILHVCLCSGCEINKCLLQAGFSCSNRK